MPLLADTYPSFLSVLWTMTVFFAWIIWFWLLITVFGDVFRRKDIGGGTKTLWLIFVIILPYLGVFIYLIANHAGMAERNEERANAAYAAYSSASPAAAAAGPAAEIEKAKQLLDSGAISQTEFDALKAKALARA
jgi:hypothetical protein